MSAWRGIERMNCESEALLRRYLEAVAVWLPAGQRNDIAAELAEDLRSRIDEQENALGHALTEDELAAILKQRGRPLAVAGSYSRERYLIGPALFPIYRFLLKLVILWIEFPLFAFIIGPLNTIGSPHPIGAVFQTLSSYLLAAIVSFTAITAIFASLERHPPLLACDWDPKRLCTFTVPKAILDADPATWARGLAQVVSSIVFAIGGQIALEYWRRFHFAPFGPGLDPVLHIAYWLVICSLLLGAVQGVTVMILPGQVRLRAALRLANAVLSLAVVAIFFQAKIIERVLAMIFGPGILNAVWMRYSVQFSLAVIAGAVALEAVRAVLSLTRVPRSDGWRLHAAAGK